MIIHELNSLTGPILSIIAILVAAISLFVANRIGRKQNQAFLIDFVTKKAQQVNSFLFGHSLPGNAEAVSGLVSTIIITQEALNKELKSKFPKSCVRI